MRLEPIPVNISLAAMLPVALALFATRRVWVRGFAVTLGALVLVDLMANLTGLGGFLWWSPIHWPSTIALGVDEIVEAHGVAVTTVAYILDLVIWAVTVTAIAGTPRGKNCLTKHRP